jgi:hypothetical protein
MRLLKSPAVIVVLMFLGLVLIFVVVDQFQQAAQERVRIEQRDKEIKSAAKVRDATKAIDHITGRDKDQ